MTAIYRSRLMTTLILILKMNAQQLENRAKLNLYHKSKMFIYIYSFCHCTGWSKIKGQKIFLKVEGGHISRHICCWKNLCHSKKFFSDKTSVEDKLKGLSEFRLSALGRKKNKYLRLKFGHKNMNIFLNKFKALQLLSIWSFFVFYYKMQDRCCTHPDINCQPDGTPNGSKKP